MKEYQFISKDPDVVEYVGDMVFWIKENSECSLEQIETFMEQDKTKIQELFEPYPETIFHDSPAKWAELLASSWGIIKKRELEFV